MSTENINVTNTDEVKGAGAVIGIGGIVKSMSELSNFTDHPMSQTEAHNAMNLMKFAIMEALKKGQKVQLTSFVSFVLTYRAARKGNNVLTNEPLDIPEGIMVTAKAGSALKAIAKSLEPEIVQAVKDANASKKQTLAVENENG